MNSVRLNVPEYAQSRDYTDWSELLLQLSIAHTVHHAKCERKIKKYRRKQ